MSMRRVRLALDDESVGAVLFTEDDDASRRHWLLLADLPRRVVLDLRVGGHVELVLDDDDDGDERRVVGYVDEVSVDEADGRLQIQGHHGLDPWPEG
jgi:hypothetical protein